MSNSNKRMSRDQMIVIGLLAFLVILIVIGIFQPWNTQESILPDEIKISEKARMETTAAEMLGEGPRAQFQGGTTSKDEEKKQENSFFSPLTLALILVPIICVALYVNRRTIRHIWDDIRCRLSPPPAPEPAATAPVPAAKAAPQQEQVIGIVRRKVYRAPAGSAVARHLAQERYPVEEIKPRPNKPAPPVPQKTPDSV
ncbi:MAG TPA: hypothetical protein PKW33_15650 [Anaerolineaceae bacterium]|nr:hypothetical protein [Anaerolineaceae bacterium]